MIFTDLLMVKDKRVLFPTIVIDGCRIYDEIRPEDD